MIRRWLLVSAACAACAACGDNVRFEDDSIAPRGGTRLALQYWQYASGARQLDDAFFDRVLGATCTAELWSDGLRYCTPVAASTFFVDLDCTREVGRLDEGHPPVEFFTRPFFLDGAPRPSRLFRGVRPIAAPQSLFRLDAEACEPVELPAAASYFELVEIPRDDLVNLATSEVQLDEHLAVSVLSSGDGLRVPETFVDPRFDVPCVVESGAPTGLCRPVAATHASYFHDATCTRPELSIPRGAPLPALAVFLDGGCPRYFERGEQVPPTPLHELDGATCTPTAGSIAEHYFLLGSPVTLPAVPRTTRAGGRLSEIESHGVPDPFLFDHELGVECTALELAGTKRCAPRHVLANRLGLHLQPDCRDAPTFLAVVPETPCGRAIDIAARFDITRLDALYHLGPPTRMYDRTTSGCTEYVAPGFHLRPVRAEIPFESLVPATLAVER